MCGGEEFIVTESAEPGAFRHGHDIMATGS